MTNIQDVPANRFQASCRLCSGSLAPQFNLKVLQKYEVQFLKCSDCESLQTEQPYWLDEAYAQNLSDLDTGAAQRNIQNLGVCFSVSKIFNLPNVIDIGGGNGLLCRLLRDHGINCFVKDKYAEPSFAQGFTNPNFERPDLVVAFEVLEHYADPRSELEELFRSDPKVLLVSTGVYDAQKGDWWYLSPDSGQHVFFYSEKSLRLIAQTYDYEILIRRGYILFVKKSALSTTRRILMRAALKERVGRLITSWIVSRPTPGVWKDYLLRAKSRSAD